VRSLPVLLALLVPVVFSGRVQTTERPTDGRTVPFLDHRPGAVVVPVSVDKAGPYRFLVDTGSTHTAVRDTVGASIGAVPVARTTLSTSAGRADALVVRLPRVAIGSAAVDELLATSLTAAAAGVLGDGIAGVIGQDFLSQFDYTLDYRRSALIWEHDLDDRPGVRVPLVPAAGRFLIEVPRPETGDPPLRLVPDSGANALVLFRRAADANVAIETGAASFELASMAGRVSAQAARVRAFDVGGVRVCAQIAGVVAAPSDAEPADGLLPLDLFASVSFNNQRRYIIVQPREP
jgi:predicted aspartyl protease